MSENPNKMLAEKIVRYFEKRVEQEGSDWQVGLNAAQEWLRLIQEQDPTISEVQQLLAALKADGPSRGSAWYEMCLGAKRWASSELGLDIDG